MESEPLYEEYPDMRYHDQQEQEQYEIFPGTLAKLDGLVEQAKELARPTPENLSRNWKRSFFGNGGGRERSEDMNITGNPEYKR